MKSGTTTLYNFHMKITLGKDNKFLIIIIYYNRPKQILRALESVKNQKHTNWQVAFFDDHSDIPGEDIVRDFLSEEDLKKFTFYRSPDTREIKNNRKKIFEETYGFNKDNTGALITDWFNIAMSDHTFDVALFLCDDDLLHTDYLKKLNTFYNNYPEVNYSFSNVILFDERYHNWEDMHEVRNRFYRPFPVNPYFNLDTSQVSWREKCFKNDNVAFRKDYHLNFDAEWYKQLFAKYGPCVPNYATGQYKNFDKDAFHL